VCRVVLQIPPARHVRLVADTLERIHVASSSDTFDSPDFLVACQRHRRHVTRMLRGNCFRGIPALPVARAAVTATGAWRRIVWPWRIIKQEGLAVASIARDVVVKITPPRDHNAH